MKGFTPFLVTKGKKQATIRARSYTNVVYPAEQVLFFHVFSGEHEAGVERETRVRSPSRLSRAPRPFCACLCSPKKREKVARVL